MAIGRWNGEGRASRWAMLAALLLSAGCRRGGIAGNGALCGQDENCRAGYRCLSGVCRAAPPDAAGEDAVDASPPPDVAGQSRPGDAKEASAGEAAPDAEPPGLLSLDL